jgi:hypothetical protein
MQLKETLFMICNAKIKELQLVDQMLLERGIRTDRFASSTSTGRRKASDLVHIAPILFFHQRIHQALLEACIRAYTAKLAATRSGSRQVVLT